MDGLDHLLSNPLAVAALIAVATAIAALARAEAAKITADIALRRTGGPRRTPPAASSPPPSRPNRRKP